MVWLGLVTGTRPRAHPVPYLPGRLGTPARAGAPPIFARDGCTSMHFGENQLSPGSIGISPLSTGHPPLLQQWWVRASTGSYPRFTLPMDSSPGFGPHPGDQFSRSPALFRRGSPHAPGEEENPLDRKSVV